MLNNFSNDEIEYNEFSRQRVPFFKFGQGKTVFRILPPHANAKGYWFRKVRRHNLFFGKDQDRLNRSVTCLDEACPICEFAENTYEEGNETKIEFAKKIKAKEEIFVNAMIFSAPIEFEKGKVYLLKLPKREFMQIFGWDRDEQMGWSDITGVRAYSKGQGLMGVKFVMERTGTTVTNTRYTLTGLPKREDLLTELQSIQVDLNSIELPDMYAPESGLSVPDASYLNDTMAMLSKELKRATSVFETGSMPNTPSFQDMLKRGISSIGESAPNIGGGIEGITLTPPSQFKFKE